MNQFLQMDIFFFVTTIVVIGIGILVGFILWRILRILGYIEEISKDVSEESGLLREDMAQLRGRIKHEGFKLHFLSSFFSSAFKNFIPKHKIGVE